MTSTRWVPELSTEGNAGLATSICDAIVGDIEAGVLLPGDELPTQRLLARKLGVSLGSVHRAYQEAASRGVIRGEVGRGSFVLERGTKARATRLSPLNHPPLDHPTSEIVDLSRNLALPNSMPVELKIKLRDVVTSIALQQYLDRDPPGGHELARAAGAKWISAGANSTTLVFGGAQLALNATICALTKPGDVILADALTYPGLRLAANFNNVRVIVLPDPVGRPEPAKLAALIKRHKPSLWFCIPTIHNPTTSVLGNSERDELAKVANRFNVAVVEDETYTFLLTKPSRSLAERCERGVRIVSMAKSTLAGMRLAYVNTHSTEISDAINSAGEALTWMTPPPNSALSSELIASGLALQIASWKRSELALRVGHARQILGKSFVCETFAALHGWYRLPQQWNPSRFSAVLATQRLRVTPADEFRPNPTRTSPNYVRISLGGVDTIEQLNTALEKVASVAKDKRSH